MTRRVAGIGRSIALGSWVATGLLVLAGCTTAGGLSGSPNATSSRSATGTPTVTSEQTDCGSVDVAVEYGPYVIAGMTVHGTVWQDQTPQPDAPDAAVGATIVVAQARAIEPGFFNTPDGSMPAGLGLGPDPTIFTPVEVQVDRVIEGSVSPGPLRILVEGGKAGCFTMNVDTAPRLNVGQRYVLFLYPSPTSDAELHPELLQLRRDAWPIDGQDVVQTVAGPMPLAQLIEAIDRTVP